MTVNAKHPPFDISKTSSSIFPLSRKLEPRGRNYITCFIPGSDGLSTSRVSSISKFSKKQSKVHKTVGGVWDLPSEPEMDGKGRMEWFLSPHKATGDDIISQSSKVVQVVFIHDS